MPDDAPTAFVCARVRAIDFSPKLLGQTAVPEYQPSSSMIE